MGKGTKKVNLWLIGFAVFTGCCFVHLILSAMNLVLFYTVPHSGFLAVLAALVCLIALLFRSGSHTAGAFTLAGTFLLSLAMLLLSNTRESEQVICTLPGSGNTCIVRKENVQIGPGADMLIADEVLIPYVLARRGTRTVEATGKPVTEIVTFETDDTGNLRILCGGHLRMTYDAEKRHWIS